jgi:NTP pyrophosphatase (non-canonical NTP hydrolase)
MIRSHLRQSPDSAWPLRDATGRTWAERNSAMTSAPTPQASAPIACPPLKRWIASDFDLPHDRPANERDQPYWARRVQERKRLAAERNAAISRARENAALRDVWAQARQNHADYSATGDREQDIRFFALGLAGEAGEVANFVKKRWRDGDGHDDDLRKEVADVFAYNIMLADALGMDADALLEMVAHKQQVFVEKMRARNALGDQP